ncbi:OsmC family protein [Sinimarinibacterium sp. CAU 1509]|uniref:OsmC family protein n=1 Tax=Sinimarinibacterium sp. CAU 1509 TaxID=2562283 RepID=UPI0010ABE0D6|nr:OsmC family protein [Sinimarinibacterium sp. CAU 1509]TJY59309.1 OsmC family protein [Sinimarinibacterium sp. CAU 1509]
MKQISSARVTSGDTAYRHDIVTGTHHLVADEPTDAGGADAGPAPYDLLLSSLGACTAITLRMYAERKQWPLGTLRVELQLFKNKEGETRIDRQLISEDSTLDEAQWQRLLEIAEKTPVTLTLKSGVPIQTRRGQTAAISGAS